MREGILFRAVLLWAAAAVSCAGQGSAGLKDTVILIIRHAEKSETGLELTNAGQERAQAYVKYFSEFQVDGQALKPDALFATADSKNSHRPRLTLEPLAKALNLPLSTTFKDKEPEALADELKSKPHGKVILACWHHGKIPELIQALGGDPAALLPDGKWPAEVFDWVIELRYDGEGKLLAVQSKRFEEHLKLKS
ncbi:MAG TPA: flagellar basal body-associated protein FliL [Verrucomicrobiae bacterium]|jgi:hypothetical protein